ncbi:hypothetical protein, partial [Streptomyces sp. P17]|uniref:hypothetical protein n=1 Tax=Streptomyces sp. P17 TaxID=3074716 RepID=UPI0028F45C3E
MQVAGISRAHPGPARGRTADRSLAKGVLRLSAAFALAACPQMASAQEPAKTPANAWSGSYLGG